MLRSLLAAALAAFAVSVSPAVYAEAPAGPAPSGSAAEDKEYVDDAFRFRVVPRAKSSRIVLPEEAQALSPDALAGAATIKGAWAIIIGEYLPDTDIAVYADQVVAAMSSVGEDFKQGKVLDLEHFGLPARETIVSMTTEGIPFNYHLRVYRNGDHCFQVLAWGLKGVVKPAELQTLVECFDVLPGAVEDRPESFATESAQGIGWRVRDGIYESLPLRLRVEAKGSWNVLAGRELAQISYYDDVGLAMSRPDGFVTIQGFREDPASMQASREWAEDGWSEDENVTVLEGTLELLCCGEPVTLRRSKETGGLESHWLQGAVEVKGTLLIVEAWTIPAFADDLESAMADAFASIQILDEEAAVKLRKELVSAPDPQVVFGREATLLNGTFNHHVCGIRSTKPTGLWDYTAEPDAEEFGEDIVLAAAEIETGISVRVEVLEWERENLRGAHVNSLVNEWGHFPSREDVPEPTRLEIGGRSAIQSDFVVEDDFGNVFAYRVVTILDRGRRIEMSIRDEHGDLKALLPIAGAWLKGLTILDAGTEPITLDGDRLSMNRLGVVFTTPEGNWKGEPLDLPKEIEHLSRGYAWKDGRRDLIVLAVSSTGWDSEEAMVDPMLKTAAGEFGGRKEPIEVMFMGKKRKALQGKRLLSSSLIIAIPVRGRVVLVGMSGGRNDDHLKALEGCLTIEE